MTIAGSPEIMRHHELVSAVLVLSLMAYILYQHQVMRQVLPAQPDKGKAALRAVLFAAAAGGVLYFAYRQTMQPRPQYTVTVNPLSTNM